MSPSRTPLAGTWDGPVVDTDVHIAPPSGEALFPYLAEHWQEFGLERGLVHAGWAATSQTSLATTFPVNAPTTVKEEWRQADGAPPGSTLEILRAQVLDPYGVDFAVVSCQTGIDSIRHPDYSVAMASAVNDWMIKEWLDQEPRLRGSIVVPAHDPAAMAAEVERVGGHPQMVQVFLPLRSEHLWGRRMYLPLFEAADRHGLVMGLHFGGNPDGPPTPVGYPSWYFEEYAGSTQLYFSQILNLLAEGVLERFPSLKVAVFEGGFLWLPGILWRLDKEWKGLRRDIPWVKQPPSTTIRERFRFSVAPVDAGPQEQMATLLDHLGSDDLLMFATDYPHDHGDQVAALLAAMPESLTAKVMHQNGRDLYDC